MPFRQLSEKPHGALIRDHRHQKWLLFSSPLAVISAFSLGKVIPALDCVSKRVEREGLWAAGFLSYEAAPAFDAAFDARTGDNFPLLWFGLYPKPEEVGADLPTPIDLLPPPLTAEISDPQYYQAIGRIKDFIARGDTYQTNFTFRLRGELGRHDPFSLFANMIQAQGPGYGAFLNCDHWTIASASPELFFEWQQGVLTCRPMKGTAPRGLWSTQDQNFATRLENSEKDRAENLMIVDMVRNDLHRITKSGVTVENLFRLERYPTLWQMTSTVTGATGASLGEIFRALYPPASITGAPKARTTGIIAGLEISPRRIYTGTIGFMAPDGRAQFNVAIRTLLANRKRGKLEYGVGGGIVWDSKAEAELAECRTKTAILGRRSALPFQLLETLLWTPEEGYFLLERHLERLRQSAVYFSYSLNEPEIREQLRTMEAKFPGQPRKVRLLLARNGAISVEDWPLENTLGTRIPLAPFPIDPADPFLYHKTTRRAWYEKALGALPDYSDVLLWNHQEELTESCLANVAVERGGEWITPAMECGLLPGTYRAWLLERGKIREGKIPLKTLSPATRIVLFNSVRGLWEVKLASPSGEEKHFSRTLPGASGIRGAFGGL